MKSVNIGYTIPKRITGKAGIDKLRLYFNGENLFEFDKMGDIPIDPEINWTSTTDDDSRSFGRSYPYRRTISFGVQMEL